MRTLLSLKGLTPTSDVTLSRAQSIDSGTVADWIASPDAPTLAVMTIAGDPKSASIRGLVMRRLAKQARRFPELDLAPLDVDALRGRDARDVGLAAAIDHAVARRWLTLRALIEPQLSRSWDQTEPRVQAALLTGAAQLFLLDRIPEHAAINETVAAAKEAASVGGAKLVNAVLRKLARLRGEKVESPRDQPLGRNLLPLEDRGAWRLNEPVFADDAVLRFAQQTSHPVELLRDLQRAFSEPEMHAIALHDLVHPPIIMTNVTEPDDDCVPHEQPGFFVYTGDRASLEHLLSRQSRGGGGARVQDPGSAAGVECTRALSPALIVDACAGMGTKTRQLRQLHPNAKIIACDVDAARLSILRRTFAGDSQVTICAFSELRSIARDADLLVLDVPCSNTGVLARRVEAKYRYSAPTIEKLVNVQRQIVADTLAVLRPDGYLLYITCSITPAENQNQVDWLRKWHSFEPASSAERLPKGLPGGAATGYADGGFHALLQRTGG